MTTEQLISDKLLYLRQRGIDSSKQELRMLLEFALHLPQGGLYFHKTPLSAEQLKEFDRLVGLRAEHCPADKIIGSRGFYKHDFLISRDVLSPRPDTETVVEEACRLLPKNRRCKILEFGVGSGCILLSLLADFPQAEGRGADISEKALKIAAANAEKLGVADRVKLFAASWFADEPGAIFGSGFDMIVSNPPYIPSGEIAGLDPEVKDFDPLIALDGGEDGLRDYRQIAKTAAVLLVPGGYLLFEAGCGQAEAIAAIGAEQGFTPVKNVCDLSGIERCIILKK